MAGLREEGRVKIEVHLLSHDDEQMLTWSLRHYAQFADDIVVHDGGPTGGPARKVIAEVEKSFPTGPCVSWLNWDTAGELNDELARKLKNSCWRGTDADWVIAADADELIYAPNIRDRLETLLAAGSAVLRPRGFEMFSDSWFEPSDHPGAQITDLVKDGAPDDKWYAKPVVFSPRLVADSGFGIGAHESDPVLRDGRRFHVGKDWPFCHALSLLHFKSIFGGLDRIAARYDATRSRLAAINVRNGWGNFKPGREHAQEKRDLLLPNVRRVVV